MAVARPTDRHQRARAMTALLSLEGVSKRFRGLVAVDDVSFEVPAGELFAVIGPNGAGKTTLFNLIAGAIAPDEGSIVFAGEPIGGLPPDVAISAICFVISRTSGFIRSTGLSCSAWRWNLKA